MSNVCERWKGEEKNMTAVWSCPQCGLFVHDEPWRREKPERTVCRNGHKPVQMELKEIQ